MLRWPMAANAPSSIEAMETKTTICCHCVVMPGNATTAARTNMAMPATFRRGGEKRRHRRRRAFVNVRRPHMERHRRNLEAEAGEQKNEAEDQSDPAMRGGLRDAGKGHGAGEAVDQRGAIKQHPRRQRAEHEIFQAGFGRAQLDRDGWRRRRKAAGSSVRGRDRARSDRRPRSASACRASRAG